MGDINEIVKSPNNFSLHMQKNTWKSHFLRKIQKYVFLNSRVLSINIFVIKMDFPILTYYQKHSNLSAGFENSAHIHLNGEISSPLSTWKKRHGSHGSKIEHCSEHSPEWPYVMAAQTSWAKASPKPKFLSPKTNLWQ